MSFPPFRFENGVLKLLDQRKIPEREVWIPCRDSRRVHWAIRNMVVRGAPAIGIVGGYGLYLGVAKFRGDCLAFFKKLEKEAQYLKTARPTGVNLRNVIDRIVKSIGTVIAKTRSEVVIPVSSPHALSGDPRLKRSGMTGYAFGDDMEMPIASGVNLRNVIDRIVRTVIARSEIPRPSLRGGRRPTKQSPGSGQAPQSRRLLRPFGARNDVESLKKEVLRQAKLAHEEDDWLCRAIGRHGARLFRQGDRVLTHCNAGGLATSGFGTALGILYALKQRGKKFSVVVGETRPLLQGARLTAWELVKSGIPCTLACDNAIASLMQAGEIDRVIVGADRIAANGDTANKIGTYNLAVLARVHGIPFYVAAPSTTFDFQIRSGREIPIENRTAEEVTEGFGKRTAPRGVKVANPAFDVTPHSLITAFITEAGVLRPPFKKSFSVIARQRPNMPKQSQRLLHRQKKAARNDRWR